MAQGKKHSDREIEDRRDEVILLLAKGFSIKDISKDLGISRQSISSDIKAINQKANEETNKIAKESLNAMYQGCIRCLNELQSECWGVIALDDARKVNAIEVARKVNADRFAMISTGPAMVHIHKLESEVAELKRGLTIGV